MIVEGLRPLAVPIANLVPDPDNANVGDVERVKRSLARFGQRKPVVARLTGRDDQGRGKGVVEAGNTTMAGAEELGWTELAAVFVDEDPQIAKAYGLADNQTGRVAEWDVGQLAANLADLEGTDMVEDLGWDQDEIDALIREAADAAGLGGGEADDDDRAPTTGERLAMTDVTFDDPTAEVHRGEVWQVGRHTLVIARLRDEHHLWADRLTEGVTFAPYPDPYITTTTDAREGTFLLVQPNLFLAAHLIDKHRSAFPDETVERVDG